MTGQPIPTKKKDIYDVSGVETPTGKIWIDDNGIPHDVYRKTVNMGAGFDSSNPKQLNFAITNYFLTGYSALLIANGGAGGVRVAPYVSKGGTAWIEMNYSNPVIQAVTNADYSGYVVYFIIEYYKR